MPHRYGKLATHQDLCDILNNKNDIYYESLYEDIKDFGLQKIKMVFPNATPKIHMISGSVSEEHKCDIFEFHCEAIVDDKNLEFVLVLFQSGPDMGKFGIEVKKSDSNFVLERALKNPFIKDIRN